MGFTRAAVERAMKVQEVILKALSGGISWFQAAEILGMSIRSLRRYRAGLDKWGYDSLFDRRRKTPSPRSVPVDEVKRILGLYRERYAGWNVRHFYQTAVREQGVQVSYTFVKQALQGAGLVKKAKVRGRHRRRRERKACFGEMLHIDGSKHAWLGLLPDEKQTLITVADDATSRVAEGVDLDEIFCREAVRMVGKDNVVTCGKLSFQISKQPGRRTCSGLAVVVKHRLDGAWSIHRGTQVLGRYDETGRPAETAGPVENREGPRSPTRTLDAGKRRRRPQLPQAPAAGS